MVWIDTYLDRKEEHEYRCYYDKLAATYNGAFEVKSAYKAMIGVIRPVTRLNAEQIASPVPL